MNADTVFVTGATGFLGHNLVPILLANGLRVKALVRETSDVRHLREPNVELVIGDVLDAPLLQRALVGCRYVVHAAGLFRFWGQAENFERVNVQGTSSITEAARRQGVEKLVFVSTIAVAGQHPSETIIDEKVKCQPADAYQRSKYDAEMFVRMFSMGAQLPAVILRPGAFYGPWGRYAFNRLFFEDPLRGLLIQVHNGQRITFPAFVPDVARAILAALKVGKSGQTYNIAGDPLTHQEVNATVSRLAHLPTFRLNISEKMMLRVAGWLTRRAERTGREPFYPTNLASYVFQDWRVSSEKARAELSFTPTPFAEGARQTLEWYWSQNLYRRPRAVPAPANTPVSQPVPVEK